MSKRLPPDQPARERIARDLDRNLLVEAGAGSGKTHEMAARMAAGVASGVYDVEHLAAVTFTRKAAAELRGRFQLALEEQLKYVGRSGLGSGEPGAGERESRLRSALSNLERFFAGTIHAFCARLLRERPVEAGVAPGFTELDETEDQMLRLQSWRDFRADARAKGDPDLIAVLDAGVEPWRLDKAFATVCQYEDVEFPPGDAKRPDAKKAWRQLEEFRSQLRALLPASVDPDSTCTTQDRADRFEQLWGFSSRHRDHKDLVALLEVWEGAPKVVYKWWPKKPVGEAAKTLHTLFRSDVVVPYLSAWRQFVYGSTVRLLTRARDAARAERRRRNILSFNDLLIITADVLRRDAGVRRSLQQKYRWLFVDEFQDTDPVQAEIMFLLAADSETTVAGGLQPSGSVNWRTVPLRPGALFVVGDPKQSIYRFRRADIEIYNEVRRRLGGADESGVIRLTTNFRSQPELCDWANSVFENVFPNTPTPHSPQFEPLEAYRQKEGAGPRIAVLTGGGPQEPDQIARYIRSEVDAGRRKYGDFLILTRKRKPLRAYARALEAVQAPIEVSGAGAFGESEEVRELALLIGALADPQDAVSLVGVLRGPLFGASDQDLFAFREAGGTFHLFSEVYVAGGLQPAGSQRVASALDSLRRWHRWTRMLPAGAALERILEDSGFLALAATSPGGVEAGDLLHAIDRVRVVVEGGFTLADAAAALAAWSGLDDDGPEESVEVDSLPLEPGRPDVVRLMNLHKAKGLEAEVVFLVDPSGGWPPQVDVRIVRSGESGAKGYFLIEKDNKDSWKRKVVAEPEGWDAHEAAEEAFLEAEVHRLSYVAATRARDLLVVCRNPAGTNARNAAWKDFDAYLSGLPELTVPATIVPTTTTESVDLSTNAMKAATKAAELAHGRVNRASWAAVSVTSEVKGFPRITPGADPTEPRETSMEPRDKMEPRDFSTGDDPTRVVSAETPSRRADAGIAWGTLVHGLLEHAMRHKAATRDDLRRLAIWLTVEEPQLRAVIDKALDTVQGVAVADFWAAARASGECHEEAPFSVRDTRDGMPTVVSGAIDLVYRDADGWRILDYKTDAGVDSGELAQRYAKQAEAYRKTWSAVANAEAFVSIQSIRQPKTVRQ